MLPRLLLLPGALATYIAKSIELLKGNLVRWVEDRFRTRPASKGGVGAAISEKSSRLSAEAGSMQILTSAF